MKEKILTFDEFRSETLKIAEDCPKDWRKGQSVFNALDNFGLARLVQFEDGVDCFYNDDAIEDFITHAYKHYSNFIQDNGKEN